VLGNNGTVYFVWGISAEDAAARFEEATPGAGGVSGIPTAWGTDLPQNIDDWRVIGGDGDEGTDDDGPILPGDTDSVLEQDSARAAYYRHLADLGFDIESPDRRFRVAAQQYEPLMDLFTASEITAARDPERFETPEAREAALSRFLTARAGPGGVATEERQIPGATSADLMQAWENMEALAQPGAERLDFQQAAIDPQYASAAAPVTGLGQSLLRSSASPLALGWYRMPSQTDLASRYLAGRETGDITSNYVDFIKKQLGLGAFYS